MTLDRTGDPAIDLHAPAPAPADAGRSAARRLGPAWWALVVVLGGLLTVRALELRIPEMTRPLWEDEIHHNESLLSSADMKALADNGMFVFMYQPLLDFWLRKAFWFPALGVDERALRTPALVYGVALVLLVYALALVTFASRVSPWWAALLAFCAALWIVNNPTQIHYSAEARHYTFVALASTLWCVLLFLRDGRPRVLFALATLLFANTHFFALPMIAAGYALQILGDARRRQYRWIAFDLAVCLAVFACTRWINYGPFRTLMHRPPLEMGVVGAPLQNALDTGLLKAALGIWLDYGTFLALPVAAWAVWLVMLAVATLRREWRWIPFFLAVFVALPAFFAYVRVRSHYPFREPYFSPFLGVGLVSLLGLLGFGLDGWSWLARRLSSPGRVVVGSAAVAAVALALGVPRFAVGLIADRASVHRVERNFSPYFLAYREIASEGRPVFVLHTHCWADDIPNIYLTHVLRMDGVFHTAADALGCQTPMADARARLSRFLQDYGPQGGIVVLDQKEESCRDRPVPRIDFPGSVERVSSVEACMWKVRGARTLDDLRLVAAGVGFRTGPGFF